MSLLVGAEATTARVQSALRQARDASRGEDDALLFYFSGHGLRGDEGLVLVTYDGDYPASELIEDLGRQPTTTAVILDCCHAGAVAQAERAVRGEDFAFASDRLQFLCAVGAADLAIEGAENGLFTAAWLAALTASPELLALPPVIDQWCDALPHELLADPRLRLLWNDRGMLGVRDSRPGGGQEWQIE